MDRMDLDEAYTQPTPWPWPGGGEQPVRWLRWRQEALVNRLPTATDEETAAIMQVVMPAILPGRSWDEIQDALDSLDMEKLVAHASRRYQKALRELDALAGNVAAGVAQGSLPPTPSAPSSVASPASMGVPCGAS